MKIHYPIISATFTCLATARKNETARSDVIVPFGLHVWKSFTCGRRVGKHLLCRLANKKLYGIGKHVHWLQISRIWQLPFMPLMLVPWIMDRTAHCKVHPEQTCTDVYSMSWCHMCKVTVTQISHRFPKHNAEKHFGDYHLILHVSASA